MRLTKAVDAFLVELALERSRATVKAYESDLNLLTSLATVAASDTVTAFTADLVRAYFDTLRQKNLATATVLRRRAALSEFAAWGLRRRLWIDNPMLDAPRPRRPVRLPKPFTRAERTRLLALELPPTETCLRALFYWTGLRATPITRIRLEDIALGQDGRLGSITTVGKGDKQHRVPILPELDQALRRYIAEVMPADYLLTSRGRPLTLGILEKRVKAWGRAASVPDCHCHRWRHSAATAMMEAGVKVEVIQKILGHVNLATTMGYVAVVDEEIERGALQWSEAEAAVIRRRSSHGDQGCAGGP
jgi:integrase/recombinase XerC